MNSSRDALRISSQEMGPRLQLALEVLASGRSSVILDDMILLSREGAGVSCEVFTSSCSNAKAAEAYRQECDAARQHFNASTLGSALFSHTLVWSVVDDYGMGRVELWRAS